MMKGKTCKALFTFQPYLFVVITCCYLFVMVTCCYLFVVVTCCFLFVVVTCCYCTEDTVISGSGDSDVRIWRIPSGECLKVLSAHKAEVVYVNGVNLNLVGLSQRFILCTKVTLDLKIFDEGFKINSLKKAQ